MNTWMQEALRLDRMYEKMPDLAKEQIKKTSQVLFVKEAHHKFFPVRRLHDGRSGKRMDTPKSNAQEVTRFAHELRSEGFQAVEKGELYRALLGELSGLLEEKFQTIPSSSARIFWVQNSEVWDKVMAAFQTFDDHGIPTGFRKPKSWFVAHPETGHCYPAKVIWGLATEQKGKDFYTPTACAGLKKSGFDCADLSVFPSSDQFNQLHIEGSEYRITQSMRERNSVARVLCIEHYRSLNGGRLTCSVCDFDFFYTYGEIGKDFIHVHHLDPLSETKGARQITPVNDLVPVCPNCHAMIHRWNKTRSISEMRKIIKRHRS